MSESSTVYTIEFAKSGRSKCKKCKVSIPKDEKRIGVCSKGGDFDLQSWYHPSCFTVPKKFIQKSQSLEENVEDFVSNVLEDTSDKQDILSTPDDIIQAILSKGESSTTPSGSSTKKASSTASTTGVGLMSEFSAVYKQIEKDEKANNKKKRKKNDDDDDDDENEDPQKKKKIKFKGSKKEQSMFEIYGNYYKYNLDDIKDILRFNRQVLVGTKDFLIYKCIDGEMNGRLARCALCGGRLKIQDPENSTTVACTGSFDEDTQMRIVCGFTCPIDQAPRWKPWFTEEPTDEEKETMDQLEAEAKGEEQEGDATTKDKKKSNVKLEENVDASLVDTIASMEWDISNKQGIKKATQTIVKALLENNSKKKKLDIPSDESKLRMEIGTMILNSDNKAELTSKDILHSIIQKYGTNEEKAKKAKKKETAIEAMCANPKNAALMAAFQELGELYFKEGNRNAGASYIKVVNVIKNLDIEITSDNALGLGKGKTKIAGIGKGSAEKMQEFCDTGTIQKLEEKRADAA